MSLEEQRRLMVLNRVERGGVVGRQAAEMLGISLRHLRRLMAAYRKEGAKALAHGNRGRNPRHTLAARVKEAVVNLWRSKYTGFNTQHFTELLEEREGIKLSRSSVRRLLLGVGIRSPRKRRAPKHRSRRERYPQKGMLLQIDASEHDWLEGRGPRLTLAGAIDDATGEAPCALFREQEDSQGYFLLFREIVGRYGIPMAVYRDRHSIFESPRGAPESLEEQLEGRKRPTQFGRLMEELGITSIPSNSPQGRGRIERLWGTFQDRLRSELRLVGAKTLEEANRVLLDFLPRYNRKFAVAPAEPGSAYRQPGEDFDADRVFCFKYYRTVGLDNVVRFGEHRLQIMPSNGRLSYARARVEVHERMDGSLAVYHEEHCLATSQAPPEAPVLRLTRKIGNQTTATGAPRPPVQVAPAPAARSPSTTGRRPAPDHPWRHRLTTFVDRGSRG
ncbi:MAG: ISNCY family transposase [Dehalococcoidia bacterium]|nr:ISNCY family transposase [Dehalococcoidia bacterium]